MHRAYNDAGGFRSVACIFKYNILKILYNILKLWYKGGYELLANIKDQNNSEAAFKVTSFMTVHDGHDPLFFVYKLCQNKSMNATFILDGENKIIGRLLSVVVVVLKNI